MKLSVIGFGGLGTAISIYYSKLHKNTEIVLWGWENDRYNDKKLTDIAAVTRENHKYLPGIKIPESINITSEKKDIKNSNLLFVALPYEHLNILERFRDFVSEDALIISGAKGVSFNEETKRLSRPSKIENKLLRVPYENFIVMSGPNFANEIVRDIKTTTVFGCKNKLNADIIGGLFLSESLRVYTTSDIIGVELGGALKNYPALGLGVCDFLIENKVPGIGLNSKAALVGRSLEEIINIGIFHGAKRETFDMPCGTADLILTCYSENCSEKDVSKRYKSRNNLAGYLKASGMSISEINKFLGGKVAEGLKTLKHVRKFSEANKMRNNIAEQIYLVFYHNKKIENAIRDLVRK